MASVGEEETDFGPFANIYREALESLCTQTALPVPSVGVCVTSRGHQGSSTRTPNLNGDLHFLEYHLSPCQLLFL